MSKGRIYDILVKDIVANPHQPRTIFDEDSLIDLSKSIEEHGLLQPIVVRVNEDKKYELIAGERRFRAFQILNKDRIPAIVKNIDIQDSAVLAMIENIQRDNLHFFEVAKGYQRLMNDFDLSQKKLIEVVGKNQSTISNKLRLLKLNDACMQLVLDNELSERHARALLKLKTDKQRLKALKHIIAKGLNVKECDKYIDSLNHEKKESDDKKIEDKKPIPKSFIKDIRLFTNTIKQAVDMMKTSGVDANYIVRQEEEKYTITIDIPIERKL